MGFKVEGLKEAEAWSASTILGEGWHEVTIADVDDSQPTRNGNPQFELRLENQDGDIRDWIVYTEATVGKVLQVLEAAKAEIPGDGDSGKICAALRGKKVTIKVGKEPSYNDPTKDRHRVQAYVESRTGAGVGSTQRDDDLPF